MQTKILVELTVQKHEISTWRYNHTKSLHIHEMENTNKYLYICIFNDVVPVAVPTSLEIIRVQSTQNGDQDLPPFVCISSTSLVTYGYQDDYCLPKRDKDTVRWLRITKKMILNALNIRSHHSLLPKCFTTFLRSPARLKHRWHRNVNRIIVEYQRESFFGRTFESSPYRTTVAVHETSYTWLFYETSR